MAVEMEIDIDGVKKIVKIRKVPYGEYLNILQKSMKVEILDKITKSSIDIIKFRHDFVKAAIENGNEIDIDMIPINVAMTIEQKVFEVNGMTEFFQ